MSIDGVTFDFWDTLFSVRAGSLRATRDRVVAAELADAGVEIEPEVVEAIFDEVAAAFHEAWMDNRQYRFGDAVAHVRTALTLDREVTARVEKVWLDWYRSAVVEPRPDAVEAVHGLAEAGVTMAIVCAATFVPPVASVQA